MTWDSFPRGMPFAERLPAIIAAREARQVEMSPQLKALAERRARERAEVADLIKRGMDAISATPEQRALVFAKTGFAA